MPRPAPTAPRRLLLALLPLASLAALCARHARAPQAGLAATAPEAAVRRRAVQTFAGLPLSFEPRPAAGKGPAEFVSRGPGYAMLLRGSEALISVSPTRKPAAGYAHAAPAHSSLVRMRLAGANPAPRAEPLQRLPTTLNYFFGRDARKWRTGVHPYGKVKYAGVYPGVDLVYYGNQRQLEYDLVVQPGANPEPIALDFSGAHDMRLDPVTGDLVLQTEAGELRQHRPIAYQVVDGKRVPIPASFVLAGEVSRQAAKPQKNGKGGHFRTSADNLTDVCPGGGGHFRTSVTPHTSTHPHTHTSTHPHVTFALGSYDQRKPLIIDPVLGYGTYFGGSGLDVVVGMTCDNNGNVFMLGYTSSQFSFPTKQAYRRFPVGGQDLFVAQINTRATGAESLVFSTYFGGSKDDNPTGFARSADGKLSIAGFTLSTDLPTTTRALQGASGGGQDGFFARLDPAASGTDFLDYSTYIGSPGSDAVHGVAVDAAGVTYLAGSTDSGGFPHVTPAAVQGSSSVGKDAFLLKLDPALSGSAGRLYGTFLGADGDDIAISVAADGAGTAYLAGSTSSRSFPTAGDPFQPTDPDPTSSSARTDGFLSLIDTTASGIGGLIYSTYLGGTFTVSAPKSDSVTAVAVDARGRAYLVGGQNSRDFPTTPDAVSRVHIDAQGGSTRQNGFFCLLDPYKPGVQGLVYSTYLNNTNSARDATMYFNYGCMALTSAGTVWVVASVSGESFLGTPDAYGGGGSGYVLHLDPLHPKQAVLYGSFLGASGDPYGATAVAVDEGGAVYVTTGAAADAPSGGLKEVTTTAYQPSVTSNGAPDVRLQKFLPNPPQAPSTLQAEAVTGRKINLFWTDNSTSETGFRIQRKTDSTAYTAIGTVPANTTTFQDSGLAASIRYTYRVQAFNAGGDSPFSAPASATTIEDPPLPPTGLRVTGLAYNRVDLAWSDGSTDETGFEIERKMGANSFAPVGAVGTDVTTFSDQTVQPKTVYSFRVRAVNAIGPSGYSNDVLATTPPRLPARPTGVTARSLGKDSIELRWDRVDAIATRVVVERKTGADNFEEAARVDAGAVSYVDTGLQPDTSYTYQLRAANDDGISDASNPPVSARTDRPTVPVPPTELTARPVPAPRGIELTWSDNSTNETGFKIERRTQSTDFKVIDLPLAHDGTGTVRKTDADAQPGTTYTYRVRASNGDGDSSASNEVSAKIPTPPAAPEPAVTLSGPTTAHLSWTDVQDEEGYRIERKLGSGSFQTLASVGSNTTSYDDQNLPAQKTCTYRVFAVNGGGDSPPSNEVAVTTPEGAPTAPSNLQAYVAASREVGLLWQDGSTNETGFRLERQEGSGEFQLLEQVGAQAGTRLVRYSDKSVQPGTTYVYRVQAVNGGGGSGFDTSDPVTTPNADDQRPVAPINLRAAGLADRIRLTWEYRGTGHTGFLIERGPALGTYSSLAVVDPSVLTYDDQDGLQPNSTYFYQVRALGPGGQSDPARADAKVNGGGLYVSPTSLDFGSVRPGTSRTKTITIQNLGTLTATVQIPKLPASFSVKIPTGTSLKVAGGATKTVTVQFKPARKGSFRATLTLKWLEQTKSYPVRVQGRGL